MTEKVHRRFSDIDWEITRLKGNLFDVIDLMHDILPHTVTTAVRKNKYQLERAIEVGVPCRVSFASALFVLEVLLKMIIPDWFQYAASAGLSTWIVTTKQPDRTIIKEEVAEKVPWRLWLREDTHLEAVDYYRTKEIADIIVDQCRGYYMNADKAEIGERTVRRYLYDEGERRPLAVDTVEDLQKLVETNQFCAFYTSVENRDGRLGKVCIDLDARWMLSTLLGPERTWSLQCTLVDGILALANHLDWPSPAIKFSGSRGIHVYWLIDPDAMGTERITIEPYVETMFSVDQMIDKKKTTEAFLSPFTGMKVLTEAMVLEAKHHYMDWQRVNLTNKALRALDLRFPEEIITVGGLEDRHPGKLSVDIISMKKGVFRSVLSPHYSTGLVSRDITNEFGQIGTEYRIWRYMRYLAEMEQVRQDVLREPEKMRPKPGLLTRRGINQMAEELSGVVKMIAKFSPARASELDSEMFQKYRKRYDSQLTHHSSLSH